MDRKTYRATKVATKLFTVDIIKTSLEYQGILKTLRSGVEVSVKRMIKYVNLKAKLNKEQL